jgi:hypothetical protein
MSRRTDNTRRSNHSILWWSCFSGHQCCLAVRPAKADAFSGRQSHQGKSQTPCSLDGREERNQGPEAHRSTIFRMAASHRAVTKVNAQVAPKNTNSGGRAYG